MHRCLQLYGQSSDKTGKYRAVYPNVGDYTISDFALNMPEGYIAYYENTGDKNKVKIEIATDQVTWAEGTFPHPKGMVWVKLHIENGKKVIDEAKGPEGVDIEIQ